MDSRAQKESGIVVFQVVLCAVAVGWTYGHTVTPRSAGHPFYDSGSADP